MVKNPVNVKRGSVRTNGSMELRFSFDSSVPCVLKIYFQVSEFLNDRKLPIFASTMDILESELLPAALDQGYTLQLPTPQGGWTYVPGTNVFPVIIETVPKLEPSSAEVQVSQLTYVTISAGKASVLKQKLRFGDRGYELHEIFGIDRNSADRSPASVNSSKVGSDDGHYVEAENDLNGTDCVICLSEPRDTTVLPCRHFCLCNRCAEIMRLNTRKCPICRQPVSSMLQIDRDMPTSPPTSPIRTFKVSD